MMRHLLLLCCWVYLCICYAVCDDPYRPQFHFLPESNWMNDPNGPFYDESTGYFHLFYQYLTPRTWGHAISTNLVDWEILDVALNYTTAWYTEVVNETAGVYSGSASQLYRNNSATGQSDIYLTASTPTNDMMLIAYPSNRSDATLSNWTWNEHNPVIYAQSNTSDYDDIIPPPGRDPTEFWACGANLSRVCVGYATQQSEGCPCNNISGFAVFSSSQDTSDQPGYNVDMTAQFINWTFEGYLANDTNHAVMWECPDFYQLIDNVWMMKFSIGPGPAYLQPWGDASPRDYYFTGYYDQSNIMGFKRNNHQFDEAMSRSKTVVLDAGAFYASKSFSFNTSRLLFGWLPEERYTENLINPWGWAGVQSLPRTIVPYIRNNTYYIKTPPVEAVLTSLRNCTFHEDKSNCYDYQYTSTFNITTPQDGSVSVVKVNGTVGQQIEVIAYVSVDNMNTLVNGSVCGLRVLAGNASTEGTLDDEYTEVGVEVTNGYVSLFVNPAYSNANTSAQVNRTTVYSSAIEVAAAEWIQLRVIIDHSVIEASLQDSIQAITRRVYPAYPTTSIGVAAFAFTQDSSSSVCTFANISSYGLRSANITTVTDSDVSTSEDADDDDTDRTGEALLIVLCAIGGGGTLGAAVLFYVYVVNKRDQESDAVELLSVHSPSSP